MALSNKGMLTAQYNRKATDETTYHRNNFTKKVLDTISKECYKPLRGKSYIEVPPNVKASDTDWVRAYLRKHSKHVKYNTCDDKWIATQEHARNVVRSYDRYTIKELQDMITLENEQIILRAIEKKIDDYNRSVREQKRKEKEMQEYIAEKRKHVLRQRNIKIMSGLACFGNIEKIYSVN